MSGNVNAARRLIAQKAELRNAEGSAAERHLEPLREGRPETLETTTLHLDVLRDLSLCREMVEPESRYRVQRWSKCWRIMGCWSVASRLQRQKRRTTLR